MTNSDSDAYPYQSHCNLTEADREEISDLIVKKLHDSKDRIPVENHSEDHLWIKEKKAREHHLLGTKSRILEKVVGGLSLAGILTLIAFLGHALLALFKPPLQ